MNETTDNDQARVDGGFDASQYAAEAEERWGHTAAYKESARRTRGYGKADWDRHQAESDAIMEAAVELFRAGAKADDEEVAATVERHRLLIDRWFYPCSLEMHAGLADMYEADARFAAHYERYAEGLTLWWSAAIRAAAERD